MASVVVDQVRKAYGLVEVVHGLDLTIEDGAFVVLLGPSGCGKSTLLRMIAGLETVTSGDIRIGERSVTSLQPKDRNIAMVFQSYALYPHMSVADNMSFALKRAGTPKAEITSRVEGAARILGLESMLDRLPRQLSGGQRQRVAMGRAIVRDPAVFLFDEPLSNLDAKLRVQMRTEIKDLHQRLGTTTVYVTHDQIEAMTMADRIVILRDGRVEQAGHPLEIYDRPETLFVAGFIGSPKMNLTPARLKAMAPEGASIVLPGGGEAVIPVEASNSAAPGTAVTLGLRPEHLAIAADGPLAGKVAVVEQLGGETLVYVDVGEGILVNVKAPGTTTVRVGEVVRLEVTTTEANLFDKDGLAFTPTRKRDSAIVGTRVH